MRDEQPEASVLEVQEEREDSADAVESSRSGSDLSVQKVLPCPFCGKLAWTKTNCPTHAGRVIQCVNCRATGPATENKEEALDLWNDRKFDHMIGSAIGQKLQLAGRRETIQRILSWAKDHNEDSKVGLDELIFMLGQALVAENALVEDEGDGIKVIGDEDDAVNHPEHYQSNGMEVIDVIEAFDLGFHRGNAIKYILRAGKKGAALEDLKKARWYLDREIENGG